MNIGQITAFVRVVEHGSFSAAARDLGVSQPAVTMQVQGLEADLGVAVFDRAYRKVQLTEAGRALLPHARRVLSDIESARRSIEALSSAVSGQLVIAASTTPGQYVLPRLLGGFLSAHPGVALSLRVADTSDVVDEVMSGRADIGVVGAALKTTRVDFEPIGTDDIVLICPERHPFAGAGPVTAGRLATEKWVMREGGSGTRRIADEGLRAAGIDPDRLDVATELGTGEAIVSAVEGGIGLGAVSAWVAEKALALKTVATVNFEGFPLARPLLLVTPRTTLTRAASEFAGYLRTSQLTSS